MCLAGRTCKDSSPKCLALSVRLSAHFEHTTNGANPKADTALQAGHNLTRAVVEMVERALG